MEYEGVVYHVQTEDKGLQTPIILSLVYTGGAILASKRSPYDDLIARGFDEAVLAQRLSRQHKLICAAVHAGRIEELKRMGERDPPQKTPHKAPVAAEPAQPARTAIKIDETATSSREDQSGAADAQSAFATPEPAESPEALKVVLLDEQELRAGQSVTLRVLVSRASYDRREPAPGARILLKTLGTSFRPTSTVSNTNTEGIASFDVRLPLFETGRAAVLVQAELDGELAELRRIILPSKSR